MRAIISECGNYRYRLERDVQPNGLLFAYFGVNPSTADASAEDATTRKWNEFTRRNGGRGYLAGNPFAWRATAVKMLAQASDPIGPENDAHLLRIMQDADVLVPCWGDSGKVPPALRYRFGSMRIMLKAAGKTVKVFGFTKSGDPAHPLMLPYATPLVTWAWA